MFYTLQPDWSEERRVVMAAESLRAELRGTEAMAKLREETSRKMAEAQRINMARYGPEVIRLFMLNSAETKIYPAHKIKCLNANNWAIDVDVTNV